MVGPSAAKRFRKGILPMVDLFAGAGGTSTGALIAFKELDLAVQLCAVNHWECAITTHELNHEGHLHFCTGVDKIDVEDLLRESDSDGIFGLWGSPSCTNHSNARGGVPINDQDRSTCWALIKWLRQKKAVHLWVENVAPFLNYGPLMQKRDKQGYPLFLRKNAQGQWKETRAPQPNRPKGMPARRWWKLVEDRHGLKPAMVADPKRKGIYFKKWVKAIRRLGYDVDWRLLNAADYGAPTKRIRLIIQAVRRNTGRRIVWPYATHAEPDAAGCVPSGFAPWRTARDIINFQDAGKTIFGRKKSLADKSIDRIAVGLIKYGFDAAVVKMKGTGTANSTGEPLGTVQAGGQHYALLQSQRGPVIIPQQRGGKNELRVKSVDGPMPTIASSGADAIATGFLVPNFGERPTQTPRTHALSDPLPAVTSHGAGGLVQAELNPCLVVVNHGNGPEGDKANHRRVKSVDAAVDTVTGSNSLAVITGSAAPGRISREKPVVVTDWRSLSAAIKAADKRSKKDPTYRPLISYNGYVFRLEVLFRMLHWRELARAQSFPETYQFHGTATEIVKQIGNAVPPALSRAVCRASISQNPHVGLMPVEGYHYLAAS